MATLAACTVSALAQQEAPPEGEVQRPDLAAGKPAWRFELTPYAWIPDAVEGNATAGLTVPTNIYFQDIIDNVNGGVSLRFEAWKGNWGFLIDTMGVCLELAPEILGLELDIDIAQAGVDMGVSYRFGPFPFGHDATESGQDRWPELSLEPMGGVPYPWLKQDVTVGPLPTFGGDYGWVEPWVGGRVHLQLNEWLSLVARGDVGGFGIGSASDLTWSLLTGAGFRLSDSTILKVG
ncbi:MAG: hypothetical protein JSV78_13510 [Phycisphaerales bacterium]|nr:MAG: hypothetical protein JSV78_13510 [Phycisphaerales bacterium]